MKMGGYIGRILLFLLADQLFENNERPIHRARPKESDKPIPKGCKEYFFNSLGEFLNKNDGLYSFRCIAINDKSAMKKFEKWVSNQ